MAKRDKITEVKGFFSEVARKHKVSPSYVTLINKGKREINTEKSKAVAKSLRDINRLLTSDS